MSKERTHQRAASFIAFILSSDEAVSLRLCCREPISLQKPYKCNNKRYHPKLQKTIRDSSTFSMNTLDPKPQTRWLFHTVSCAEASFRIGF